MNILHENLSIPLQQEPYEKSKWIIARPYYAAVKALSGALHASIDNQVYGTDDIISAVRGKTRQALGEDMGE